MNARTFATTCGAALSIAFVVACSPKPPDVRPNGQVPPATTAVGPVPGGQPQPPSAANPFANDRTAMAQGRQLFIRFNCSGCHGGRAGGGMGPSLRDVDWIYGNDDQQLFSTISEGRAHGMPSWSTKLSNDQVWQLVTYIKSLRTSNEPQRPES